MKKALYKFMSIIISASIFLSFSAFPVFAQGFSPPYSLDECRKIFSALTAMESIKNQTELSNVDFSKIKISNTIKTYNYTSEGLVFNYDYIALKYNNKLVCWQ